VLPLRRTTFVLDTDRTILKIIRSELRASAHADQALKFLREDYRPARDQPAPDQPPPSPPPPSQPPPSQPPPPPPPRRAISIGQRPMVPAQRTSADSDDPRVANASDESHG
jgi:peroxiredoxin Q/BCP